MTVLSEAPGAAEYLDGGFVTYTSEQKCEALGLDPRLIDEYGAVSAEVADAMARGALEASQADIAVSVTGVAGPEPDERGNPVGLVYLACARGPRALALRRPSASAAALFYLGSSSQPREHPPQCAFNV